MLAAGQDALGGRTRARPWQLSIPSDLGRNILLPWLDAFLELHPELQLRIQISLIGWRMCSGNQVDVALRYGAPPDSSFCVAIPLLAGNRAALCASTFYRHGELKSPAELVNHNVGSHGRRIRARPLALSARRRRGIQEVRGDRLSDDGATVRRWAPVRPRRGVQIAADIWREPRRPPVFGAATGKANVFLSIWWSPTAAPARRYACFVSSCRKAGQTG